jgi:hypothetical protein
MDYDLPLNSGIVICYMFLICSGSIGVNATITNTDVIMTFNISESNGKPTMELVTGFIQVGNLSMNLLCSLFNEI